MELCHFCGNKHLSNKVTQYSYQRDGKYLIIHEVPCIQCDYCGEQYFQAAVLKKIEREFEAIYLHGKQPKTEIRVPMEEFLEWVASQPQEHWQRVTLREGTKGRIRVEILHRRVMVLG